MTVLAADSWPTNADLILACVELGYLRKHWRTLDPTYGKGKWWTKWRPPLFVRHDIDPEKGDGVDFRDLPHEDGSFKVVTFDPPYMAPGGRDKSTIADFNDRFGLHSTPRTPMENQESMNLGLAECVRVVENKGLVLVKCMDYINGARFFPGTHHTLTKALELDCRIIDRFEHVGRPGPQPTHTNGKPRRQVHARRNLSTLFVFQKWTKETTT